MDDLENSILQAKDNLQVALDALERKNSETALYWVAEVHKDLTRLLRKEAENNKGYCPYGYE